ncbi:MAG: diguanylate cyclase [Arenicellales bacterium]
MNRNLSVSIGVAALQPGENQQAWEKRCDSKLYQVKSNGRNRFVSHALSKS